MPRSCLLFFALLFALGCRSGTERAARPNARTAGSSLAGAPPNSQPAAKAARPSEPLPGSVFADLERAAAPVQAELDAMALAIRSDSGTARSDSDFVRFRNALGEDLRAIDRVAGDHDLEDLFHLSWMPKAEQAEYLRAHGIPNDTVAWAITDSIERFLAVRSIQVEDGEGGPSFAMAERALSKSVGRFLSPAGREYLELSLLEQSQPTADDAYLKISWNEFGDRLAMTDHIVTTYTTSPFADELRGTLINDLRLYLRGSEGFDASVPEMPRTVTDNIKYFLAKYGSTPAGAVVRGYRDALTAQGYRGGKTLDDYLAKMP